MKIFRISSLYILLYISFITLFLYTAYVKTDVKKIEIGTLKITEKTFVDRPLFPQIIRSFFIEFKGITFDISRKKPVKIVSSDGVVRNSHIKSVTKGDDRLRINLENSTSITFSTEKDKLVISSSIPKKSSPEVTELYLPIKINYSHDMEETELSYRFYNSDDEFHLKFNDNYTINREYIVVKVVDAKLSNLTFSHINTGDLSIVEEWYMKHRATKNLDIKSVIDEYLIDVKENINSKFDKITYAPANSQWKGSRTPTSWNYVPSRGRVSENQVIVYLADSIARGTYFNNRFKISGVKERYPDIFSYKSSPFLGESIRYGNEAINEFNRELQSIINYIKLRDERLLKKEIESHFFKNRELNLYQLNTFLTGVDKKSLNLEELSATLGNLINIAENDSASEETFRSITEVTELILEKVIWKEDKLYLIESGSNTNQLQNLKTGLKLLKAAKFENSEYTKPVAEALIYTALQNRDESGNIYHRYSLKDDSFSTSYIQGSDIFLILSDNPFIPKFRQFDDILIYSLTDVNIDKNYSGTRLSEIEIEASYPFTESGNIPHSIIISGIEEYRRLYLGGINWSEAIDFERYHVGCYYNEESSILYVMSNSKAKEKLRLTY